MKIESVVCVPGPWEDPDAMVEAVTELLGEEGPRFGMAEELMVELVSEDALVWRWAPHREGLARTFSIAGRGSFGEPELAAIGAAPGHAFLVDPEGGSLQAARRMMIFADALLRAGGLGVKVESAGVAHSVEAWREMTAAAHDIAALLAGFVTVVGAPGQGFYTCGMHNLGLPEALVPASLEPEAAVELLDAFTLYLAAEEPVLEDGQTFAAAEDAPQYELAHQPCEHFEPGDPFHNPFGMWALHPLEDQGEG
jgi:hypothetical protein